MVHGLPGPEDDELCIRATALEVTGDAPTRERVRTVVAKTGVGGMIDSVSKHALFEFDVEQVDAARWLDIGQSGTRAVRWQWRAT